MQRIKLRSFLPGPELAGMNDAAAFQAALTDQGWIEFAGPARKGVVPLKTVLKDLLAAEG